MLAPSVKVPPPSFVKDETLLMLPTLPAEPAKSMLKLLPPPATLPVIDTLPPVEVSTELPPKVTEP